MRQFDGKQFTDAPSHIEKAQNTVEPGAVLHFPNTVDFIFGEGDFGYTDGT